MRNKIESFCTKGCPKFWVASITGPDEKFGYKRDFVTVSVEKEEKSVSFFISDLPDGLYQFGNQITVKNSTTQEKGYFCVKNSQIRLLPLHEVPVVFSEIFGQESSYKPQEKNISAKKEEVQSEDDPFLNYDPFAN